MVLDGNTLGGWKSGLCHSRKAISMNAYHHQPYTCVSHMILKDQENRPEEPLASMLVW